MGAPYTLAMWQVRPGREAAFVAAWDHLAQTFAGLPAPPEWGTLLQSDADPSLFYSFGPWRRLDDIAAMRSDAGVQEALQRVRDLCENATPGVYRVVRHVDVDDRPRDD